MLLNDLKIKVLEEFLRNYQIKLTGSFIAKKKGLNQKSAANTLNELERENILKSKIEGRNKLYYLNLDNRIQSYLISVEYLRTFNFLEKNPIIKEIISKLQSKGILIIFGSYAKNLQKKDSDLDLLIIGNYNEKNIKELEKIYNLEINIKKYDLSIFKKPDHLFNEVIKDHILIKGGEDFVENLLDNGNS